MLGLGLVLGLELGYGLLFAASARLRVADRNFNLASFFMSVSSRAGRVNIRLGLVTGMGRLCAN